MVVPVPDALELAVPRLPVLEILGDVLQINVFVEINCFDIVQAGAWPLRQVPAVDFG